VNDEQLVTDVLSAIAWIERLVARKTVELGRDERLSDLTSAVAVGKTFEVDYPPEPPPGVVFETEVVVSAYVDGSIKGAHGIAWTLALIRRGQGWILDRGITLHANDERDDVVESLPVVAFQDSAELVAKLPILANDWLGMAIPPLPQGDSGG
jgi:hypothetical protein